jgi:hypothetical protein
MVQHLKILGFPEAGLTADESEAPVHDQVFNPKKEAVYARGRPQGLNRNVG